MYLATPVVILVWFGVYQRIEAVYDFAISYDDDTYTTDASALTICCLKIYCCKIFVCLWLGGNGQDIKDSTPRFAVKLTPERNEELREKFSAVQPAWHWNKKHWSDIYYAQLKESQVKEWIKESYLLIASKLPKAIRQKYIQG